jgi:hypothetical protein
MAAKTTKPRKPRRRKTNVVQLTEIRNERRAEEAASVLKFLHEQADMIAENMEEEFSGYALVMWTRAGATASSYSADYGSVAPDLVPTLAHDALNRQVAVEIAAEEVEDGGTG